MVTLLRMRLGEFDPPALNPWKNMKMDVIDSDKHRELATQAARESIVLLKNSKNLLPLDIKKIKNIAVIGIIIPYSPFVTWN